MANHKDQELAKALKLFNAPLSVADIPMRPAGRAASGRGKKLHAPDPRGRSLCKGHMLGEELNLLTVDTHPSDLCTACFAPKEPYKSAPLHRRDEWEAICGLLTEAASLNEDGLPSIGRLRDVAKLPRPADMPTAFACWLDELLEPERSLTVELPRLKACAVGDGGWTQLDFELARAAMRVRLGTAEFSRDAAMRVRTEIAGRMLSKYETVTSWRPSLDVLTDLMAYVRPRANRTALEAASELVQEIGADVAYELQNELLSTLAEFTAASTPRRHFLIRGDGPAGFSRALQDHSSHPRIATIALPQDLYERLVPEVLYDLGPDGGPALRAALEEAVGANYWAFSADPDGNAQALRAACA